MLQLWVILDSNNKPKSLSLTPIAVKPAPPNLAPASDQPAGLTFTAWAGCLGTAHLFCLDHFRTAGRTGRPSSPSLSRAAWPSEDSVPRARGGQAWGP